MKSTFLTATLIVLGLAISVFGQASKAPAAPKEHMTIGASGIEKPWTGDLDGMQKRRVIRVLTVYSKMIYFVDKGQPKGVAYDLFKQFETDLNKKLKTGNLQVHVVFFTVNRDELLQGLVDGKGDIAAANLTITPERQKVADFTNPLFSNVSEVVVTGPGSPAISSPEDLSGKMVYVRKSSSYYESLTALNDRLKSAGKPLVILKEAPETLEDEDLMEMVNAGLVKFIVVDNHIANFWKQIFPNVVVHSDIALHTGGDIAWAIRQDSPLLKGELNSFIKANAKGTMFGNMLFQKYLKSAKYVKNAGSEEERKKFTGLIDMFRKYGSQYSVDWLLMAAQGYQESRLDQTVKSQVGAIGVMQVMPATGKDMKVGDITQIDPNINAGIKYMRWMMNTYFKDEPMDDFNKMIFSFASYNCGPGRVKQLRATAAQRGLNPNVWFGNVERIASEKIGRETVTYVSNIYKYYLAYSMIMDEMQEREKAMQEMKKPG